MTETHTRWGDAWDPALYNRFQAERAQPFWDLLASVQARVAVPSNQSLAVLDLGCGTAELTRAALEALSDQAPTCSIQGLGVDVASAMVEASREHQVDADRISLRVLQRDLLDVSVQGSPRGDGWDVVLSNAALQWVPDHPQLFQHITALCKPGALLAVQVPANHNHPSHEVARHVARSPEFAELLNGYVRPTPVLTPSAYTALLHALGYTQIRVALRVYPHVLPSPDAVVQWVRATLLTPYQARLSKEDFERFLHAYRNTLLSRLPKTTPYLYPFERILITATAPNPSPLSNTTPRLTV